MRTLLSVVVTALLTASVSHAAEHAPVRVLMIVGGDYHDYEALPARMAERVSRHGEVAFDIIDDLAEISSDVVRKYDVLLFNTCVKTAMSTAQREAILEHLRAGKGLIGMHCSLWSFQDWPAWRDTLGGFAPGHDKYGEFGVTVLDIDHPVMLGLGKGFSITDEPYWVDDRGDGVEVLVRTTNVHKDREGEDRDRPEPQVWTQTVHSGRVLSITFGHDEKSQTDDNFIRLLHNGIRWVARRMPEAMHNTLTPSEQKVGFELLFDGKSLDDWEGDRSLWRVENGEIVGRAEEIPAHTYLFYTKKTYTDFELRCSVRLSATPHANSGIQVRSKRLPEFNVHGLQADIAEGAFGSLFHIGEPHGKLVDGWTGKAEKVAIVDGWNHVTVIAEGPRIRIKINGLETVDHSVDPAAIASEGLIGLQLHKGPPMAVRFRDIRVRELHKEAKR